MAWHPLGWRAAFFSEVAAFPRAVLAHHYPDVPLRGDFTEIQAGEHDAIDVLVGGTPCQSFSVAGLRGGWQTHADNWPLSISSWLQDYGPAGWYGRTCPESCRVAEDLTLVPFSGRWGSAGMGSPTECLTLNFSDYPSDASVCSLSAVLETGDVPRRFFLSQRACAGILRRAGKRGKELPRQLAAALRAVAGLEQTST